MTLLDILTSYGTYKKFANGELAGPCPFCGGNDRFRVWPDDDKWWCRGCDKSGNSISLLREKEGMACSVAHAQLGKVCESTTCKAIGKCKQGKGEAPRRSHAATPVQPKQQEETFIPAVAQDPAEIWQEHAEKLVAYAHEQLLNCPEQLAYLAGRGLDLEYIKAHCFGWLPKDEYRARVAWGLPIELKDGKPKKLWLPKGIVIPSYVNGVIHRLRIRKHDLRSADDARYYWVPGSGNDVVVINPGAQVFVIVEADLDGHLVNRIAGDLVGSIALGTCSAHPKEAAYQVLCKALAILVALDFDPGVDEKTGGYKNPGGKSSRWWLEQFPRARRWPVVGAKDPGDAFKAGIDIRAWILAGLPPAMTISVPAAIKQAEAQTTAAPPVADIKEPASIQVEYIQGTSKNGHMYFITDNPAGRAKLAGKFPGKAVFTKAEILKMKGMTPKEAEKLIMVKEIFGVDADIAAFGPAPSEEETVWEGRK